MRKVVALLTFLWVVGSAHADMTSALEARESAKLNASNPVNLTGFWDRFPVAVYWYEQAEAEHAKVMSQYKLKSGKMPKADRDKFDLLMGMDTGGEVGARGVLGAVYNDLVTADTSRAEALVRYAVGEGFLKASDWDRAEDGFTDASDEYLRGLDLSENATVHALDALSLISEAASLLP